MGGALEKPVTTEDPDDTPLTQQKFKIVVVSPSGAGSTCVFKRFIDGQYVAKHEATEQAAVGVKSIRLRDCSTLLVAELWDLPTAGILTDLGTPHSLGPTFFEGVHGIVFVYDLEKPDRSASALAALQEKIREHHPEVFATALPLLLANKHDSLSSGSGMRRRAARRRTGVAFPAVESDDREGSSSSDSEEDEVEIPNELYASWTPACVATHTSVSARLNYGIHAALNDLVCRIYEESENSDIVNVGESGGGGGTAGVTAAGTVRGPALLPVKEEESSEVEPAAADEAAAAAAAAGVVVEHAEELE